MDVSSILKRKGTHVESAHPDMRVRDAARRISELRVGSLVVMDDEGNLAGMLCEADLVRAIAQKGAASLDRPISLIMESAPRSCRPEDELQAVMRTMTHHRTRHLPVIAGEAVVGIVSLGDVVNAQLASLELEIGILRDHARFRTVA